MSGCQSWNTPPEVFEMIERLTGSGTFDLDPCSNSTSIVPAATSYSVEGGEDGLVLPWHGRVFVNPPFSDIAPWAKRFVEHSATTWRGGFMLVPAVFQPKWARILRAAGMRFVIPPRRFAFLGRSKSPPAATMLVTREVLSGVAPIETYMPPDVPAADGG